MDIASKKGVLRTIPSVDELLKELETDKKLKQIPSSLLTNCVRKMLDEVRKDILEGKRDSARLSDLVKLAQDAAQVLVEPSLKKVINVSGIIIHTNLGRSNLSDEALAAVCSVAKNYSTLEYDTATLSRGSRHTHCEELICALTGAEAAIAVNNNAAAVMMILSEFAAGKQAIVSRGELIEIGGSFRIPDIMELSRAHMVEVGTTNKTHPADYETAITPETAMLLKVHPSNYRLVGFTENVDAGKLRALADKENKRRSADDPEYSAKKNVELLVYEDLGSGALIDLEYFGAHSEPTVSQSLESGCDLVSFSGDKLLGGPQAGIIVGRKRFIDRLKKNPLARALRLDKMTIAALEATLRLYLDPAVAVQKIPTLAMISAPASHTRKRSKRLAKILEQALPSGCAEISVVEEKSRAGGGSLPMSDIPSHVVRVEFLRGNAQGCDEYLIKNRPVPIVARIKKEAILCDIRTLEHDEDFEEIAAAFTQYFAGLQDS